ncbi:MAG: redox-sensing transcriptional repressor Rex [Pirellulaceae bacterium]
MVDTPSKTVVARMSRYLRQLERAVSEGRNTISSKILGEMLSVSDSQVRKDLARLEPVGHPGVGFRCDELIAAIRRFLGVVDTWPIVVVGCGNLGQALIGYKGFSARGFKIAGAFDISRDLIGKSVHGVTIQDFADLRAEIADKNVQLAALCVPTDRAQVTAEDLVKSGIGGILNFAPVFLSLPGNVHVSYVDLTIEMEQLVFAVVQNQNRSL